MSRDIIGQEAEEVKERPSSESNTRSSDLQQPQEDSRLREDIEKSLLDSTKVSEPLETGEETTKVKEKYYESNAGDGSKATDQHLTGIKLALTLLSTVLALFASALDQTIVSTILTKVGTEFGSFEKVGWITTSYLLPMAVLSPSYGKISIAFGRKYTLLAGLILFMIGSLVCALSQNMDLLIGGRIIQGIGGGTIQAMVMVILSEVVPISKRSLSISLIGMTFSIASALGPFIGGAFTTHVTWRWCFYLNLPIGGVGAAFLLYAFKPPTPKGNLKEKLAKIDYIGTFLLVCGLVLILLGLTFGGNEFAWKSAAVIACFTLGGLLTIVFLVYNFRYSKNPIIIKEVVTVPPIFIACLAGFLSFAQFMINVVFIALYYQVVQNNSAWQSGIALLPFVITVSITSVINGGLIRVIRFIKLPMMLCAITALLGSGLLLLYDLDTSFRAGFGILVVNGITAGLSFQSSLLAAQLSTPNTIQGSLIIVTTFNSFFKSIGGVLAISIGQLILHTSATSKIDQLQGELDPNSTAYQVLLNVPANSIVSNPRIINDFPKELRDQLVVGFLDAFKDVFYFSIAISSALVVTAIFTTNKKIPKDQDVKTKEDEKKELEETGDKHNNANDSNGKT